MTTLHSNDLFDIEVDVLVIGCGMAGMSAAGYAATHGLRVLAVDKAPTIGGSSVMSGTTLWTAPSMDAFRVLCPTGDESLGRVLVDEFPRALEWVRSTGVEFTGERSVLRYGRGYRFDVVGFLAWCRAEVERAGGWVLPGRRVLRLLSAAGRAIGATVADAEGTARVGSAAVVLATGGFQADPDLRRQHLAGEGTLLLRSNTWSTGDGMRLGQAQGARVAGDLSAFYGHSIAAPVTSFEPRDFGPLALQYSAEGVVVNTAGERFVDESLGDHVTAQRLVRQAGGRGLVVVDSGILRSPSLGTSRLLVGPDHVQRRAEDVFGDAVRAGAHVATADDLETLGRAVGAWGFDGAQMASSVRRFNDELEAGAEGCPPRRWNRTAVDTAPFWAVEVAPSVTFTEGGLAVDADARVLRNDGEPCPGLFAAGADIGGVYEGGYAGGLALALVFALQAIRAVLADRQSRPGEVPA